MLNSKCTFFALGFLFHFMSFTIVSYTHFCTTTTSKTPAKCTLCMQYTYNVTLQTNMLF